MICSTQKKTNCKNPTIISDLQTNGKKVNASNI